MSRTLPFFIVSILVQLVFATPLGIVPSPLTITNSMLHWASLGDSWATGVTWKKELDYDEDHDEVIKCRRSKESYAYQMSQNDLLFPKQGQVFKWPACSGSAFGVMAAQAEQMDEGTSFATLTWVTQALPGSESYRTNHLAALEATNSAGTIWYSPASTFRTPFASSAVLSILIPQGIAIKQ